MEGFSDVLLSDVFAQVPDVYLPNVMLVCRQWKAHKVVAERWPLVKEYLKYRHYKPLKITCTNFAVCKEENLVHISAKVTPIGSNHFPGIRFKTGDNETLIGSPHSWLRNEGIDEYWEFKVAFKPEETPSSLRFALFISDTKPPPYGRTCWKETLQEVEWDDNNGCAYVVPIP